MFYCNNRKSPKARATNSLSYLCLGMLASPLSLERVSVEVSYLHKFQWVQRGPLGTLVASDVSGWFRTLRLKLWDSMAAPPPLGTCRRSQFLTSTQNYRIRNSTFPSFCHLASATPEILGDSKKSLDKRRIRAQSVK